jgi:hypothetical protein
MSMLGRYVGLYGKRTNEQVDAINKLNSRYESEYDSLSEAFKAESGVLYETFNSDRAIRLSTIALTANSRTLGKDAVRVITEKNYKRVNARERDYMLGDPTLFKRATKQTIAAYRSKNHELRDRDLDPYRRNDYIDVMDGVTNSRSDKVRRYRRSVESKLSTSERLSIMESWNNALRALENDIDMTDI